MLHWRRLDIIKTVKNEQLLYNQFIPLKTDLLTNKELRNGWKSVADTDNRDENQLDTK